MPNGAASILLASASAIERLRAEGGLQPSFFSVFHSKSVLDTAGAGLDNVLHAHSLVACDRTLVTEIDATSPETVRLNLYRSNFIAKLARRRLLLLVVLEDEPAGRDSSLENCVRDATLLRDAHPHSNCEVIVVATGDMTADAFESLETLRELPSVSRIYVMTKWLQAGRDDQRVALSRNVWPTCVARLLVTRAAIRPTAYTGSRAAILAWRTFAWGTLTTSKEPPSWEAEYLHCLRDQLIPSLDSIASDPLQDQPNADDSVDTGSAPPDLPPMNWADGADSLRAAGSVATDDSCLINMTRTTCSNATQAALKARHWLDAFRAHIRTAWARVASNDGLAHLRSIREGRHWHFRPLAGLSQNQQDRWRQWNLDAKTLEGCRINHEKALDALALARSRHLNLGWHCIIGAMVLPFVFQFLVGILLPLRSADTGEGTSVFAFPRKSNASVAYLVDRSSSMAGLRFDRMKSDLKAAIDGLPDGTQFTVAAFSDQLEEMPPAKGSLINATRESRDSSIAWLDGLATQGSTAAVPGLRKLISMHPDSLVFLTDGLLTASERDDIAGMLADKSFLGKTRIDTVMLYPVGEEAALKDLAKTTGGQFRRVGFDPLAPLGFNRVLFITFCATAAGVALGAWLPWFIERASGNASTQHLSERLRCLLADYGRYARQTAVTIAAASGLSSTRRANAAWSYQGSLAARALGQVEASLANPSLLHEHPKSAYSTAFPGDALAAEDWQDVHDVLDEPMPDLRPVDLQHEKIRELAAAHAHKLCDLWRRLASECDPLAHGHLPVHVIAEQFHEAIGYHLVEASWQLFLPRRHSLGSKTADTKTYYDLFGRLTDRISDDVHRPFLSARVVAHEGLMPPRALVWIGRTSDDSSSSIDVIAKDYFLQRTQIRFVSDFSVSDVGLRALGLIHDEMEVSPHRRADGTYEFVVTGAL